MKFLLGLCKRFIQRVIVVIDIDITYEEYLPKFRQLIKRLGLKQSVQRELVLDILFHTKQHLSAQEIVDTIKKDKNFSIGLATVYKILTLFDEFGIIKSIKLEKKEYKVYELNIRSEHDHIVCTQCMKIVEFYSDQLQMLQKAIVKERGFVLQNHNMTIYGICKECQDDK